MVVGKFFNNYIEIKKIFNIFDLTEEEIRNKFLKKNGIAFVEESNDCFLSMENCIDIIKDFQGLHQKFIERKESKIILGLVLGGTSIYALYKLFKHLQN